MILEEATLSTTLSMVELRGLLVSEWECCTSVLLEHEMEQKDAGLLDEFVMNKNVGGVESIVQVFVSLVGHEDVFDIRW